MVVWYVQVPARTARVGVQVLRAGADRDGRPWACGVGRSQHHGDRASWQGPHLQRRQRPPNYRQYNSSLLYSFTATNLLLYE
jgi:hypothetical protein